MRASVLILVISIHLFVFQRNESPNFLQRLCIFEVSPHNLLHGVFQIDSSKTGLFLNDYDDLR
jgi:hypothetical protein